jgi:hypothetical protein
VAESKENLSIDIDNFFISIDVEHLNTRCSSAMEIDTPVKPRTNLLTSEKFMGKLKSPLFTGLDRWDQLVNEIQSLVGLGHVTNVEAYKLLSVIHFSK